MNGVYELEPVLLDWDWDCWIKTQLHEYEYL